MARLWPFFSTPFSSLPASPLLPVPIPLPTTKEAKDEGATLSVLNTLLEPFKGQDIPLAARSDPTLVQKEELPFTVSKIWQYVPFLASQGAYSLAQATPRLYARVETEPPSFESKLNQQPNSLSLGPPLPPSQPPRNSADSIVKPSRRYLTHESLR